MEKTGDLREAGRKNGMKNEREYLYAYARLTGDGMLFPERIGILMKKSLLAALLALLLLASCGCAAQEGGGVRIVTTFYPMYVFALNVTEGIEGVAVQNMADQSVGCLHDYQLQTRDMVALEGADALIINGGGMEQFMDKVISLRADLPVIDASAGIDMLPEGDCEADHDHDEHCSCHDHEHHHDDDDDDHDHEHHDHDHDGHDHGVNAHVWLDPKLAAVQVENIGEGLAAADPAHADAYRANAAAYAQRLTELDAELSAQLAPVAGERIITFHEAFPYFANAYGIEIAGVIEHEPGEDPGTREIAQTCDLVTNLGIRALFVEPQYPQKAAETIARETGAGIYTLDPVVSGDGTKESYETIMRENARVLLEALKQ